MAAPLVTVTYSVNPALRKQLEAMQRLDLLTEAGQAVYDYLVAYHSKFADKWKGQRYLGAGPNSGQFAKSVVAGWQKPQVSPNRVTIRNSFGLLAWKVSGGTINATRAEFLTIPLIPAAKGLSAHDFRQGSGLSLFRVGNALVTRIGKRLQAVYALKKSVQQQPWPGALPDDAALKEIFQRAAQNVVSRLAK
jgi:hypothetical protein